MALIGRGDEQASVAQWLAARTNRVAGTPPALFVVGEAGVGKSALVGAAAADPSLSGIALHRAAAVPWPPAPFALLSQLGVVPGGRPVDVDAIHRAVTSRGPAILVLDDLHWADEASLALVAPLADALADQPVALLGAYRADELPRRHLLRRVRAQLRHRRQHLEIALRPLPPAAVRDLIAAVVGGQPSPHLAATVAEKADGVPFLVEELVAGLAAGGRLLTVGDRVELTGGQTDLPLPDSVRDAVLLRTAGLTETARAALDLAAVIGLSFTVDTVAAQLDQPWPDELDHSGLIRLGDGGGRSFRHALTQEAVYAELPWSRRRELHLRLAAQPALAPATVARHLLAADEPLLARPALLAAADEHLEVQAYRDAARLLDIALQSWTAGADEADRLAVVDQLARCAELCGDHALAVQCLRELSDRRPAPETSRRLAGQYEQLGHWPLALSVREAAAAAFVERGDPAEAAIERLAVAAHLRSAASFQAALDVLTVAESGASTAGRVDLLCRIQALRGNVLARQGRFDEGVGLVRAALDRTLHDGLAAPAAEIYQRLADTLEHGGDYRSASEVYVTAAEFCAAHQQDAAGQLCRACATVVMFHRGQWDSALALCAQVRALPSLGAHATAVATGVTGIIHALRGRPDARAMLLEARTTAVRIDLIGMELVATWGLALLDEAAGRPDRAAANYRQVLARCRQTEERHYCIPILQYAAAFFASTGQPGELGPISALLAQAAEASEQAEARAGLAFVVAETTLATDGSAAGIAALRRAVSHVADLDLPLVDLLVRHRLGTALAAAVDPPGAREALRAAQAIAHRLKARILADRAAAALSTLDRAEPARAGSPLTPREREVLTLAGEGLTSRDIAQRLVLSPRTVDMHIGNAIAKLGCRSRTEAVRRLADLTRKSPLP